MSLGRGTDPAGTAATDAGCMYGNSIESRDIAEQGGPPPCCPVGAHHGAPGSWNTYGLRVAISVALAEDSLIVREGLRQLLATEPEIDVVAACGDLDTLLEAVESHRPDVVLTDIRMPPTGTDEGIRAAQALRESHPDTGVVVLSQYGHPSYALSLLEDGSDRRAYLLKQRVHERAELVRAIRCVAEGGSVIDLSLIHI